jgi:hypothetical protein
MRANAGTRREGKMAVAQVNCSAVRRASKKPGGATAALLLGSA